MFRTNCWQSVKSIVVLLFGYFFEVTTVYCTERNGTERHIAASIYLPRALENLCAERFDLFENAMVWVQ